MRLTDLRWDELFGFDRAHAIKWRILEIVRCGWRGHDWEGRESDDWDGRIRWFHCTRCDHIRMLP